MADEMLTAKKIADKIGVPQGKVAKFIKDSNVEPDQVKAGCKYFGPQKVAEIEKALK